MLLAVMDSPAACAVCLQVCSWQQLTAAYGCTLCRMNEPLLSKQA